MDGRAPEEYELIDRLQWFVTIRYFVALALAALALAVRYVANIEFDLPSVLYVTFFIALYNVFLNLGNVLLLKIKDFSQQILFGKILAYTQSFTDIIALTVILYLTGSIENPFIFYYVFHLLFAAILLSPAASIIEAIFIIVIFSAVVAAEFYGILPHKHLDGFIPVELFRNAHYVIGTLAALYSTIIFSVIISASIITNLRRRERQIIELSEELERRAISCELAYDELQNLSVEKAKYIRKISHELKSPVSAIQTAAETLIEGYAGDIPEQQRKLLRSIIRRSRGMINLIVDMLSLSKVSETLPRKFPEPTDLGDIIWRQLRSFEPFVFKKNLKLHTDIMKPPGIWAFKEEMSELVKNLLENAIKYTPEGGDISVVLSPQKKAIKLVVSDSGIGIKPFEAKLVFEEFYRGDRAKQFDEEGSGLGLSIVKNIAEKHGGAVEVFSKPGKGTTFTVSVPYRTGFEKKKAE